MTVTENRWQFLAVTGNITEDGEHVRAISAVINYLFLGECNNAGIYRTAKVKRAFCVLKLKTHPPLISYWELFKVRPFCAFLCSCGTIFVGVLASGQIVMQT